MRLLLDTHVLIWWLAGSPKLSKNIRDIIANSGGVFVSVVSAWEIAIKTAARKMVFDGDLAIQLSENNFRPLPVALAHAVAVGKLPRLHGDPFDRMLVAQARLESLTLVTADKQLADYDVPILVI